MMEDELYQIRKPAVVKIEDNKTYQGNCQKLVKDVLYEDMVILMKLFLDKAAVNMGKECYDAPEATKDSIMEFLYKEFRWLPVYCVGSAIIKGSLDDKSPARLIPRTVRIWLNIAAIEFRRDCDHKVHEELYKDHPVSFDLHKYPIGRAIGLKIDWYKSGKLDIRDWDVIPLKRLAEIIGQGHMPTLEMFNL
jgi:hypothetical protein